MSTKFMIGDIVCFCGAQGEVITTKEMLAVRFKNMAIGFFYPDGKPEYGGNARLELKQRQVSGPVVHGFIAYCWVDTSEPRITQSLYTSVDEFCIINKYKKENFAYAVLLPMVKIDGLKAEAL